MGILKKDIFKTILTFNTYSFKIFMPSYFSFSIPARLIPLA